MIARCSVALALSLVTTESLAQACLEPVALTDTALSEVVDSIGAGRLDEAAFRALLPPASPSQAVRCVRAYVLDQVMRRDEAAAELSRCESVFSGYGLTARPASTGLQPVDLVVASDVTSLRIVTPTVGNILAHVGVAHLGPPVRLRFSLPPNESAEVSVESRCQPLTKHSIAPGAKILIGREVDVAAGVNKSDVRIDGKSVDNWPIFVASPHHVLSLASRPSCTQLLGDSTEIRFSPACTKVIDDELDQRGDPRDQRSLALFGRADLVPQSSSVLGDALLGCTFDPRLWRELSPSAGVGGMVMGRNFGALVSLGAMVKPTPWLEFGPVGELAYVSTTPEGHDDAWIWTVHPRLAARFGFGKSLGAQLGVGRYFVLTDDLPDSVMKSFWSVGVGLDHRWLL